MADELLLYQYRRRQERERNAVPRLPQLAGGVRIGRLGEHAHISPEEFRKNYRLNQQEFLTLCTDIQHDEGIARRRPGGRSLPVEVQVASCLRFFASGSFQNVCGDVARLSQPAQSRIVAAVTDALARRANAYIAFNLYDSIALTKAKFANVAGMPNCVGCIDCTHVHIQTPPENGRVYVNRKNRHSMNVQAIVDAEMRFINLVARFPGSSHDAFIWENSVVCADFRDGRFPSGWLLGDSGYPLQPWMLTPVLRPQTAGEQRYNTSHTSTRSCVERAFGLLKCRFRCLDNSGGILCYSPARVCKIILSCCILHNICIERRIPVPEDYRPQQVINDAEDPPLQNHPNGLEARNHLIQTFFN